MRVVAISRPGGPEVLSVERRPRPVPAPGEVLIRVAAAGVNRPDCMQREGIYPAPAGAPEWPGLEVAGHVDAVGEGVENPAVGRARLRTGSGRGLRRVLRGAGGALPFGPGWRFHGGGRGHSGNLVHCLDQPGGRRPVAGRATPFWFTGAPAESAPRRSGSAMPSALVCL